MSGTFRLCRTVQNALPASTQPPPQSLKISVDICVQFPTYHVTLSRLDALTPGIPVRLVSIFKRRYWTTCQRLQQVVESRYQSFCNVTASLEQHGGGTDRQLQQQVSRGFAQWYEHSEIRLANVILARFDSSLRCAEEDQLPAVGEKVSPSTIFLADT